MVSTDLGTVPELERNWQGETALSSLKESDPWLKCSLGGVHSLWGLDLLLVGKSLDQHEFQLL